MQSLTPREAQVREFVARLEAAHEFELISDNKLPPDIDFGPHGRPDIGDYYDQLKAASSLSHLTAQQVAIIEDFTAAFVAGLRVQGLLADMAPQDIGRLRDRAIARIDKARSTR